MKIIIIIICLLFSLNTAAKAQTINTDYDTCSNLQQYQGEWRYTNGSDTIKIYVKPHRGYFSEADYLNDQLWGWHEYKIGNTIIESNYTHRFDVLPYLVETYSNSLYSIWLRLNKCNNTELSLKGFIADYNKGNNFHNFFITLNAAKTQMTCHIQERGAFNPIFTGITLPQNFTLIKQ